MQISTFFVPLADDGRAQDDLNSFLRGRRVLKVGEAFAGNGWAFCVEWLEEGAYVRDGRQSQRRVDYREVLEPAVFERFAKLRERRKAIAAEDGVPPYMVMTDAQMAEAAKPERLTAEVLKAIEGFGEARLKKYGERIMA
ncbi:MAG: HRDC domain-containing protein [Kiritimatiellae bacterium]|nr:HRDC domain-containing protein [Kiritimatiellia bacterium]